MKLFVKLIVIAIFTVIIIYSNACVDNQNTNTSLVNLSHLDHLYEEIEIDDKSMAIIHIYANYPDYKWTDAPGEGTACIDDVTRAAIVFLRHYIYTREQSSLAKANKLLDFVLYMQAPNGLFYNFIFSDLSINKTGSNSLPKTDWWTWRSIWALAEGMKVNEKIDKEYYNKLDSSIKKTFQAIDSMLIKYPNRESDNNFKFPTWLPSGVAADQASVLMLGLDSYYQLKQDSEVKQYIEKLGEGIMAMQIGDSLHLPYGVFLSWRNLWHAYGNSQASSLLLAGKTINNDNFIYKGLDEVKYFYPYLIKNNYLNLFHIKIEGDKFKLMNKSQFAQIAYGIRPMAWASLQAHNLTKNKKYAVQAGEISTWFLGNNVTGKQIYNPDTGRCYDGIENETEINKNSGAESTIEALLTLLEVENNLIARQVLHKYYDKYLKSISN